MPRVRKPKPRIDKKDLKNARLWAEGLRETILKPYLDDYSAALDRGTAAERILLRRIIREFFGRIHWSTPDSEEVVLRPWDPNGADVDETLSPVAQAAKAERIKFMTDRIRRWFRYRVRRANRFRRSWTRDHINDPFARFLLRLGGTKKAKKRRQPFQQFMSEAPDTITPRCRPGVGSGTARVPSSSLTPAQRGGYAARAKEKADQDKAEYDAAVDQPADTSAEARHQALMRLVHWIGPILQEIFNMTGCHATLLVGGPQPELGGDLSVLQLSFGRNLTPEGLHWGQWDRQRFRTQVLEFFVEYLQTAYTAEDCAKSAVKTTETNFDPLDPPPRAVGTAAVGNWVIPPARQPNDFDPWSSEDDDDDEEEDSGSDEGDRVAPKKRRRPANSNGRLPTSMVPPAAPAPLVSPASAGGHLPYSSTSPIWSPIPQTFPPSTSFLPGALHRFSTPEMPQHQNWGQTNDQGSHGVLSPHPPPLFFPSPYEQGPATPSYPPGSHWRPDGP
ncbi:hypothetical protein C8F01DRAFT_1252356 [Mycena amicta]|nr:hypothetical protein C8F01DRAFT_1252356 [Mycena amicta]